MQRFKAGELSFVAPESWHEVTLSQFITLSSPEATSDPAFLIPLLTNLPASEFRNKKAPFGLSAFVLNHLDFITEIPETPSAIPTSVVIDGKLIELPSDLGVFALCGQMWDVELEIKSREQQGLPVTPITMASVILPVFLWSLLRSEPYKDRYQAAELWPTIATISSTDGLAIASFFLDNSLTQSTTGTISVTKVMKTDSLKWQQRLRLALTRITATISRKN